MKCPVMDRHRRHEHNSVKFDHHSVNFSCKRLRRALYLGLNVFDCRGQTFKIERRNSKIVANIRKPNIEVAIKPWFTPCSHFPCAFYICVLFVYARVFFVICKISYFGREGKSISRIYSPVYHLFGFEPCRQAYVVRTLHACCMRKDRYAFSCTRFFLALMIVRFAITEIVSFNFL